MAKFLQITFFISLVVSAILLIAVFCSLNHRVFVILNEFNMYFGFVSIFHLVTDIQDWRKMK
jgi:hypothetical protein